nr:SUMF1/EgtB/PvdO family nonheme iron enzyme [Treponema sp.]
EWEYAARAGDNTTDRETWSGTNEESLLGEYAWYLDNSGGTIQPVKGKKPNAWGLYDMSGNVWEWCWDAYSIYSGESETDPTGPASGSRRIRRGGGYDGGRPVFFRQPTDQKLNKSDMTGFRVVRTAVSE